MTNLLTITMTAARYVEGVPRAPGDRVKVTPALAHEIVVNGWARFADDADAEVARQAFVAEQTALLRRVNGGGFGARPDRNSPWQPWH